MHTLISGIVLQVAGATDTVLMRMVPGETSAFDKILGVAQMGAVVLAYVLMGAAVFAVFKLQKSFEGAKSSLDEVGRDIKELVDNANAISRHATSIMEDVKANVDGVSETVAVANRRAQQAVGDLADRVDDFNRTLGLVQTETQDVVVGALAAIKGVKAGVRALGRRKRAKAAPPSNDVNEDGNVAVPARPRLKRRARVET